MLVVSPAFAPPSPPRVAADAVAAVSESFFLSFLLFSNNSVVRYNTVILYYVLFRRGALFYVYMCSGLCASRQHFPPTPQGLPLSCDDRRVEV